MKCFYYGNCPFNKSECQEDNPFITCLHRKIIEKYSIQAIGIKK